jgi:hypothetical protein
MGEAQVECVSHRRQAAAALNASLRLESGGSLSELTSKVLCAMARTLNGEWIHDRRTWVAQSCLMRKRMTHSAQR